MGESDRVKRIGRADLVISHGNSRAVARADSPRELFFSRRSFWLLVLCHLSDVAKTVWRSCSLTSASAHAERNAHGGVRSLCAFRCANSGECDEQWGDLGLCQTHVPRHIWRSAAIKRKTGAPTPQKGTLHGRPIVQRATWLSRMFAGWQGQLL